MVKRLALLFLGLMAASAFRLLAEAPAPLRKPKPMPQPWVWSRLGEDLTRMAGEVDGRVGVFIQDLATGETFSLRGDESFPTASTIKLALLLELYRRKEGVKPTDEYFLKAGDRVEGSAILGQMAVGTRLTLRDLALFTVAVSDNTAANALIDRLGMDRVNATLEGLGLHGTRLRRKMMDGKAALEGRENIATPRELAGLLRLIHEGPALTPAARADLMGLLETPKDGYLTRLLPEDLPVASKPGSLSGVRNDVGLVLLKDRPFVIAVMTSHLRDERQGEAVIARIALRAAQALDVAGSASPEGRLLSPLLVP